MTAYPVIPPSECDTAITLILPSAWVSELNELSHAGHQSRLGYIRSRLRRAMDADLEIMRGHIKRAVMYRDAVENGGEGGFSHWEESY